MQIRCKQPKSSADNYYPLTQPLPASAMGDYLYYALTNLVQVRIGASGSARFSAGQIDEWGTFSASYPIK